MTMFITILDYNYIYSLNCWFNRGGIWEGSVSDFDVDFKVLLLKVDFYFLFIYTFQPNLTILFLVCRGTVGPRTVGIGRSL